MGIFDKILDSDVTVESLTKKHMDRTGFYGKAGLVVGGMILAGAIADAGLGTVKKSRAREMEKQQERNANRKRKARLKDEESKNVAYYDMMQFDHYIQNLYANRKGSSNTYGGKRY